MGTYYYLYNDTKEEEVHLDDHIKRDPITSNKAVHYAFVHYMYENLGDSMRLMPDSGGEPESYEEVDLLKYEFNDPYVIHKIVEKLNDVYGGEYYIVKDGIGVEIEE